MGMLKTFWSLLQTWEVEHDKLLAKTILVERAWDLYLKSWRCANAMVCTFYSSLVNEKWISTTNPNPISMAIFVFG
jgi:hypothetical protein